MNKISAQAARLIPYINRRPQATIEGAVALFEDVASVGRSCVYLKRRRGQRADEGCYREALSAHVEDVAVDAMEILCSLGVEDLAGVFSAEYERASEKHPGMTLDSGRHTDESRFYALAEEAGEVCAALAYDNATQTGHNANLVSEVTQVGALALAWLLRYQDEEVQ